MVLMSCAAFSAQAESLRLTSNVIWSRSEPWFGGLSGLEISANGLQITTITDRSTLLHARLIRENEKIVAIQLNSRTSLRHANGTLLKDTSADSEGLAISATGMAFLSFEHRHRIARINLQTGVTQRLPDHPKFDAFPKNSGMEALAIHPDGRLFTLPETSDRQGAPFPMFAFDGKAWRVSHHIPRRGPFRPVGADFDRNGRFYLLERAVTPLGFRSRIRRFDLNAPDLGEDVVLTTFPGQFDNLESIGLWRDTADNLRITMISDDNFLRIQRTQIVEYVLN